MDRPPPKLSRSALRRRSIQAAQEERAKLGDVPVLGWIDPPAPPLVMSRTFRGTSLRVDVPRVPLDYAKDYAEADVQLQVTKGGKLLDSLRPPSRAKLRRGGAVRVSHEESQLTWMMCGRSAVSRYDPDGSGGEFPMDDGLGNPRWSRVVSLTGKANILDKCAFRVRVRFAAIAGSCKYEDGTAAADGGDDVGGWSPWSRVGAVQQGVEQGKPPCCGRALCFQRSQTSVLLKWPGETPREYCRRLRQQGQWGSAAELAALSVVLGREIRVFVKTPGQAAAALPGKLIQRFGAREDRQGGGNDAHWRSDANSNHSISADPALPPSKESPMADLVWSSAVDRAGGVIADGSTALSPSAPLNVLYTGSSHYSALLRHRSPPADRRRVAKPPPVPSSRL